MTDEMKDLGKRVDAAQRGASALADRIAETKRERDALEKKKAQIEDTLVKLKEFTENRIKNESLYRG